MSVVKKKYFQTYRDTYTKEFPCIIKSTKGEKFVFCSLCRCDFNISHGGKNDIKNHIGCSKHLSVVHSEEKNKSIKTFFQLSGDKSELDVIRAECLFTSFLVEHNLPISVADHAGPLFRKMFPTSSIAAKYGCARTKSTAIISEMAVDKTMDIIKALKCKPTPFSIAVDGSNDSDSNLYPLVVTFFDENKVVTCVLSISALVGNSTGLNIANLIKSELKRLQVPIEHCISFSADNAPVMIGHKSGVATFLKQDQSSLFVIGCPCHLINLAAQKSAASLPVNVDEILIDIFFYLEKSAKRKEALRNFQLLHNKEVRKIIKHVNTRWLSLGKCLTRLLDLWEPLLSFFHEKTKENKNKHKSSVSSFTIPKKKSNSLDRPSSVGAKGIRPNPEEIVNVPECKSRPRPSNCKEKDFKNKLQKFINNSKKETETSTSTLKLDHIEPISRPNLGLSKPNNNFKRSLDTSPNKIKKMKSFHEPLTNLDLHKSCLSKEDNIFMFLSSNLNKAFCTFLSCTIPIFEKTNTFLQSETPQIHILRQLLIEMLMELLVKFVKPVVLKEHFKGDNLGKLQYHCTENQKTDDDMNVGNATIKILNKMKQEDKKCFFKSVRIYFVTACDYIINKFPLQEELLKHAEVARIKNIENSSFASIRYFIERFPFIIPINANENENSAIDELQNQFSALQVEQNISSIVCESSETKIDVGLQWKMLLSYTNVEGLYKYSKIASVMLSILTIPHSNAACERVFSLVKKNRTMFRSSMSDKTLENFAIIKCKQSGVCFEQKFTEEFLKKAKKATSASLQSSSK